MSANSAPVLIMAGGTGGHIFPGIAVAKELMARAVPVLWLGSEGGLESRLVPQAGIELKTIAISGVRGKGVATLLVAPFRILRAVLRARKILAALRPRSVLSLGGYAAGPGGIAAWLCGVPLIVHEQNSIAGVTNRVLARFAGKRLCGFADALKGGEWVGNPVRADIAALPAPGQRFAGRDGKPRLLVLGGSQGAQALNTRVPQALAAMPPERRPQVRHQCGARLVDAARAAYAQAGVEARVEPFIENMAEAYAWADFLVCRAGALTLAELAAVGIGSLLIPFPHAVDDHQMRNAQSMVAANAAVALSEADAGAQRIGAVLDRVLGDRALALRMAEAARTLARPDAATRIADICLREAA